jgi:hypothetical protein
MQCSNLEEGDRMVKDNGEGSGRGRSREKRIEPEEKRTKSRDSRINPDLSQKGDQQYVVARAFVFRRRVCGR